jgi:hypothetical protein
MSQYHEGGFATFKAANAIAKYQRVKMSAAETVDVAGLTDKDIGTATEDVAAGARITVRLRTAPGTHRMIANVALAVNATGFTAAAGRIAATAVGAFQAVTVLEASGAAGDVIEVLYNQHGDTAG